MKSLKRLGALLFALAMFVTMLPIYSLTVFAAGTLTVSDTGIGLSWTDASSSSGKATWTASGTTITGTATGYKALGFINSNVTTKLTIKNNYADTRTLSFSYTLSGGGSVSGISGNAYSGELAAGGTLVITLTSPKGTSTNTLTITDIKLVGSGNVTATFAVPENGSYTVDGTAVTNEVSYTKASADSSYTLAATANSGYTFFGWYNETASTYVSYDASCTITVGSDATVKPVFISVNAPLFTVGGGRFYDLSEAVAAAQAGSDKKIVVAKDGTVTGTHTIPSGITLLVPYNDANSTHGKNPSCTSYDDLLGGKGSVAWVTPTRYRTLTLGADAHITVNGVIEVGGRHASAAGGSPHNGRYGGSPTGPLGFINMQAGSHIDLNSGATLYCWGYIYGDGTITAKSGATIYENFQIMDFRGGDKSTELAQGFLVFPTAQYHVQNIEVATTYEYGSTEYVHTSVYMSRMEHGATVQFIGANAMFRPQPGSYVVKDYDPTTDSLYLDSYGDCALSELAMKIAGVDVDAGQFVLPITNNMHIRIKSGTATLQQNVMMLPGSSLTVDQGATLNIAYTDATTDVVTAGGYILQMFDYDNYTWGIDMDTFEVVTNRYYNYWDRNAGMRSRPVPFTCTTRKTRTEADLVDAKLDINGTLISNGYIYSTVTYADILNEDYTITGNGANIISSEGTGTIQLVNGAGGDVFGVMYDQGASTEGTYYYIPIASAQLRNADGTMLDTTGAEAGTTYQVCPTCGCWYTGECEDCKDPCADGHSYAGVQTTAPTCTTTGVKTYTCSVCGDSYTETIAALGHTPGAEADCENAQTCTACGEVLNAALGHSWNDATCTAPKTCSVCGETEGEALGHSWNDATCTDPKTCSVCGETEGEALGHSWNDATCTAPKTCSVCGETEGEALGHNWNDATCTDPKTCSVCGETEGEALGHTWTDATCTDPKTCSVCGETEGEALGHTWTDATCTDPKTCSVCGETEGEALGHTWTDATCTDPKTCSVCGETEGEALGHNWTDATCTAPKTCSVCGETEGEALGHNYVGEETLAPTCGAAGVMTYTCSACGDSYTESIDATGAHTYDHDFDTDCNECDAVREVELPIIFAGNSITEQDAICKCGLAFRFNVQVNGMTMDDKNVADYTNATIGGYKLIRMGAVVTNKTAEDLGFDLTLENAKPNSPLIDIFAAKMFVCNENEVSFAVRIKNIPEDNLNSNITAIPYFIIEVDGQQYTIYGEAQATSYQVEWEKANASTE